LKELTTTKKKANKQLEKQQVHKEQMKDKDLEKERIKAEKSKDNNYSKLLAKQDCKHAKGMIYTKQHYGKAESNNLLKHTLTKAHTDTKKTDTAVARAVQAAIQVQMTQYAGHFLNPRGVDLEWVSTTMTWGLSLTNLMQDMDHMLTRASYHQPTLMQMDLVKSKGPACCPMPQGSNPASPQ
jgi:hypothetical protein